MMAVRQGEITDLEGAAAPDVREGLAPDAAEVEAVEARRLFPVGEFTGEVHPVAALFPMMTEDELDDLAADIKANGLVSPIVLDENGMLIDGRNRLVGCRRAAVPPRFTRLNGHEAVAFILSANVARRHLSKGQQVMAMARARPILNITQEARTGGLSRQGVSRAVLVLRYAEDMADAVLAGSLALNDAYDEARRRKEAAESDGAKFGRLQAAHPDLAVLVREGQLTLAAALVEVAERRAAEEKRKEEERANRRLLAEQWNTVLLHLDPRQIEPAQYAASWAAADPNMLPFSVDFSAARVRRAAVVMLRIADMKEAEEHGNEKKSNSGGRNQGS